MERKDRFPTGRERKKLLAENSDKIEKFKKDGLVKIREQGYYQVLDSPLDVTNYFEVSFFWTFKDTIDPRATKEERESLVKYIETILAKREGEAIGIEMGGRGLKLFQGFRKKFFKKSIGVTLVNETGETGIEEDEEINHVVIPGDILDPKTYETINKITNGEKVDLIIERMFKLEFVPIDPFFIGKILETWYGMLRDGGVMFVETPFEFNNLLKKWGEMLNKDYGEILYFRADINETGKSAFCLRKLSGAPSRLPFLDVNTVNNTPKNVR